MIISRVAFDIRGLWPALVLANISPEWSLHVTCASIWDRCICQVGHGMLNDRDL